MKKTIDKKNMDKKIIDKKKIGREWLESVVQALLIVFVLFLFFWPVRIEGISMEHTFMDGDCVVVSRLWHLAFPYEYGDIIVAKAPIKGETKKVIKRIVAFGGDTVKIENGKLYVNGVMEEGSYFYGKTLGDMEMTLPPDTVFLMGDNRENSTDSRTFGAVNKKDIVGKVILRLYPVGKWKIS